MTEHRVEKIDSGYILLARQILNSEIMDKPPMFLKLWVWMLEREHHKNGHNNLKREQFLTSVKEMQDAMTHRVGARIVRPSSRKVRYMYERLAEYDIADISAAFTVHVKQSRFLPTVAEIIQIIKGVKDPQISIEARALQQWRVVMSAVRKYGINKPPKFADPGTRRHEKDRPYRVHGFKVSIWRKAFVDRRS